MRPFHMAICEGSLPEILRVRLLSSPQQRQAAAISSPPLVNAKPISLWQGKRNATEDQSGGDAPRWVHVFTEYDPRDGRSRDGLQIK